MNSWHGPQININTRVPYQTSLPVLIMILFILWFQKNQQNKQKAHVESIRSGHECMMLSVESSINKLGAWFTGTEMRPQSPKQPQNLVIICHRYLLHLSIWFIIHKALIILWCKHAQQVSKTETFALLCQIALVLVAKYKHEMLPQTEQGQTWQREREKWCSRGITFGVAFFHQ